MKVRVARRSLAGFTEAIQPWHVPARHHKLVIEKLEAVERGENKRLMIFAPPGSAKSTWASILFAAWFMGRNPDKLLIAASHGQELAERFGRRVRNIVGSQEFRDIFGVGLAGDNASAARWATDRDGEYYAVGVGGSVTGRRADGALIDDPVKGREEADSETIRKKVQDWYRADLWTRLKPGAWVILIQTRWHEDDLAGWLLEEEKRGGEKWDVLSLPMLAEENDPLGRPIGEPLWPEWFTPDMIAIAKRDARNWAALYQQRPAPDEGDYFKADWFRWYDAAPARETLRVYGASDYAVTADGGDWTVHVVVGVDPADNMYLLDIWRGQTDSAEWIETFCDLVLKWKPQEWGEETGQIKAAIGPFLMRRMQQRQAFVFRRQFPTRGDKATRAQSIRARMQMQGLYLKTGDDSHASLMRECLTFPAGKHDDQVDALGLIGQLLDHIIPGSNKPKPQAKTGYEFSELMAATKRRRQAED